MPLVALLPDQLPDAVHDVALPADQLKVDELPVVTEFGVADRLTVGAGVVDVTETAVDPVAFPLEPVHVNEKLAFALSAPVDCEPLKAFVPDHDPAALQAVALVEDHVSVELPPEATVPGLALIFTVGAGFGVVPVTVTVAD